MESFHTSRGLHYQRQPNNSSARPLAIISGNVQTFALDTKDGIENQDYMPPEQLRSDSTPNLDARFPVPKIKLGSNDQHAQNLLHLQARRQQKRDALLQYRRCGIDKPYLRHTKYISYRARPRRDVGKDGKPIWDDRIEAAFQNALVNIEPMGRKKRSQRGKACGRNELISDWIFQETGEHRTRKQVSSHIQVLNSLLHGLPEWDAVIKVINNLGKDDTRGNDYHYDSIKQKVHLQKATSNRNQHYEFDNDIITSTSSLHHSSANYNQHHAQILNFVMWVSQHSQMDHALHNYTSLLPGSHEPMPVENIRNWRGLFPGLAPIVENWTPQEECNIIKLDTSISLMSDFPPKHSKLGISLELDFQDLDGSNLHNLQWLTGWSCLTRIYQHGRMIKEGFQNDCPVTEVGKIKPFFESKWWAEQFTRLVEKKKVAEESKSDGTVELANETCRNFIRGLTITQEIFASASRGGSSNSTLAEASDQPRRMAILLWSFSQAQPGYSGTTSWRKLIAPPNRIVINSPTPLADMSLPPLAVDSMIEGSHDVNIYESNIDFLDQHNHHQYNVFEQEIGNDLCEDGFLTYKQDLSAFDVVTGMTSGTTSQATQLSLSLPSHTIASSQEHEHISNNFFDIPHALDNTGGHGYVKTESFEESRGQNSNGPLANFDMNTHKMLQAQLAATEEAGEEVQHHEQDTMSHFIDDDETLHQALIAASSVTDFDANNNLFPQMSGSPFHSTSSSFPMTMNTRPALQTHHSFAGISELEQYDHPETKEEFAHVIANLQAFNDNHTGTFQPVILQHDLRKEHLYADDTIRPHSQPVTMATMRNDQLLS